MQYTLRDKLVIGISSTSLFDLSEDDEIFKKEGLKTYCDRQINMESEVLKQGSAFHLVRDLLELNDRILRKRELSKDKAFCEVILMSKNSPDTSLRIFNSIEHYELPITRAVLSGGRPLSAYFKALNVGLFLSTDQRDVNEAYKAGIPSALVYPTPLENIEEVSKAELKIAFDGDAVIFSEESEKIYQEQGLEAFLEHEKANENKSMNKGPFFGLLKALAFIQKELGDDNTIRTALVTARNSPAHKRVLLTLREWGVRIDEAFFLGGVEKSEVIKAFQPHFFFDDQDVHLKDTSKHTPVGRVPNQSNL
jgi:5'-nucleotidase